MYSSWGSSGRRSDGSGMLSRESGYRSEGLFPSSSYEYQVESKNVSDDPFRFILKQTTDGQIILDNLVKLESYLGTQNNRAIAIREGLVTALLNIFALPGAQVAVQVCAIRLLQQVCDLEGGRNALRTYSNGDGVAAVCKLLWVSDDAVKSHAAALVASLCQHPDMIPVMVRAGEFRALARTFQQEKEVIALHALDGMVPLSRQDKVELQAGTVVRVIDRLGTYGHYAGLTLAEERAKNGARAHVVASRRVVTACLQFLWNALSREDLVREAVQASGGGSALVCMETDDRLAEDEKKMPGSMARDAPKPLVRFNGNGSREIQTHARCGYGTLTTDDACVPADSLLETPPGGVPPRLPFLSLLARFLKPIIEQTSGDESDGDTSADEEVRVSHETRSRLYGREIRRLCLGVCSMVSVAEFGRKAILAHKELLSLLTEYIGMGGPRDMRVSAVQTLRNVSDCPEDGWIGVAKTVLRHVDVMVEVMGVANACKLLKVLLQDTNVLDYQHDDFAFDVSAFRTDDGDPGHEIAIKLQLSMTLLADLSSSARGCVSLYGILDLVHALWKFTQNPPKHASEENVKTASLALTRFCRNHREAERELESLLHSRLDGGDVTSSILGSGAESKLDEELARTSKSSKDAIPHGQCVVVLLGFQNDYVSSTGKLYEAGARGVMSMRKGDSSLRTSIDETQAVWNTIALVEQVRRRGGYVVHSPVVVPVVGESNEETSGASALPDSDAPNEEDEVQEEDDDNEVHSYDDIDLEDENEESESSTEDQKLVLSREGTIRQQQHLLELLGWADRLQALRGDSWGAAIIKELAPTVENITYVAEGTENTPSSDEKDSSQAPHEVVFERLGCFDVFQADYRVLEHDLDQNNKMPPGYVSTASVSETASLDDYLGMVGDKQQLHVLLCGLLTDGSVALCARRFAEQGYRVTVVEDCCAGISLTWHQRAMSKWVGPLVEKFRVKVENMPTVLQRLS